MNQPLELSVAIVKFTSLYLKFLLASKIQSSRLVSSRPPAPVLTHSDCLTARPPEILHMVVGNLNLKSLTRLRRSCRRLKALRAWKSARKDLFQRVSKYNRINGRTIIRICPGLLPWLILVQHGYRPSSLLRPPDGTTRETGSNASCAGLLLFGMMSGIVGVFSALGRSVQGSGANEMCSAWPVSIN
jgi:hypothetical protein